MPILAKLLGSCKQAVRESKAPKIRATRSWKPSYTRSRHSETYRGALGRILTKVLRTPSIALPADHFAQVILTSTLTSITTSGHPSNQLRIKELGVPESAWPAHRCRVASQPLPSKTVTLPTRLHLSIQDAHAEAPLPPSSGRHLDHRSSVWLIRSFLCAQ